MLPGCGKEVLHSAKHLKNIHWISATEYFTLLEERKKGKGKEIYTITLKMQMKVIMKQGVKENLKKVLLRIIKILVRFLKQIQNMK